MSDGINEGRIEIPGEIWDRMTDEQQAAILKAYQVKKPGLASIAPKAAQVANGAKLASQLGGGSSAASGAEAVGTAANGGTILADGSIVGETGADAALGGVGLGGLAAGGYTGYQQLKGAGNVLKDEKMSLPQQAALFGMTGGLSVLANKFLGRGESHLEEKARQKLAEQGVNVPNSGVKEWENNPIFKESRNEADLTGKDIINSASLWSLPGYSALDDAHREAVANEALKRQLVREHNGGIDVAADEEFNKFLQSQTPTQTQSSSRDSGNSQQAAVQKKQRKQALLSSLIPEFSRAPDYGAMPNPVVKNPYL